MKKLSNIFRQKLKKKLQDIAIEFLSYKNYKSTYKKILCINKILRFSKRKIYDEFVIYIFRELYIIKRNSNHLSYHMKNIVNEIVKIKKESKTIYLFIKKVASYINRYAICLMFRAGSGNWLTGSYSGKRYLSLPSLKCY